MLAGFKKGCIFAVRNNLVGIMSRKLIAKKTVFEIKIAG